MPLRERDEPPAVRVYTVCDESKYLLVRNVPSLGCGNELSNLFGTYGQVEECKPMDAEECEPYTDVYWIKFSQVKNARLMERYCDNIWFAKRKLDDSVFYGNRLQVCYVPEYESLSDTQEKLEGRRREVPGRAKFGVPRSSKPQVTNQLHKSDSSSQCWQREYAESDQLSQVADPLIKHVSSDKEYFQSASMNQRVKLVREKLNKIQSSSESLEAVSASKKARVDNRRRI